MIRRLLGALTQRLQLSPTDTPTEVHNVRGFLVTVENSRPDIETADVLARLDEALALIERYQAWRLAHLQRDLSGFLVTRYACRGAYFPDQRICMTELTFLARRDISAAPVASSILHEGIHARISQMARVFGPEWEPRDRAREERLCRKAELQFGLTLPPELGAPVVERAQASLALADEEVAPVIDWRIAQARQTIVDIEASALPQAEKKRLISEQHAIMNRSPNADRG